MIDALIVILVLAGCCVAYFVIGDLFDRWFGKRHHDPEDEHRKLRPLSHADRPAHDPRKDIGGFTDENYKTGTRGMTTPSVND